MVVELDELVFVPVLLELFVADISLLHATNNNIAEEINRIKYLAGMTLRIKHHLIGLIIFLEPVNENQVE